MGAHHHHGPPRAEGNSRRLKIVLGLSLATLAAEVVGGWLTNSLALLADAGHVFSDAAALALSLAAMWIARQQPRPQNTFGYHRAEILAALANGATLIAIALFIFVEAWERLWQPAKVEGLLMFVIAVGGLIVNLASLAVLNPGKQESLNLRGAWLHVLTDALGSIGAILAAILVWAFRWDWADPALSIVIGLLVIYSAWSLVEESVSVLMESAPGHISVDDVRDALRAIPGVEAVHDLHVWTITSGHEALSAHVVTAESLPASDLLQTIRHTVHDRFGIHQITIQIEPPDFPEG